MMKKDSGNRANDDAAKKKAASNRSFLIEPQALKSSPRPITIFGGKGGVGKTTAAAAAALYLLDHAKASERILLFSTDPAHSLSDSFETEIGDKETEVARRGKARLVVREMDTLAALDKFKSRYRAQLALVADRGTLLDESDINELLDLSLPGMDEVMALLELSEIDRAGKYSRIVVDTAPTGHTSRLLKMPEVFSGWIAALDRLQEKHRFMVAQFARSGRSREDEVETFLRDMRDSINRSRAMLYDTNRASFVLVTIAEAMAVEETSRYFNQLKSTGVPVTDLIINRVSRERADCPNCRARARSQKPWLKRIKNEFAGLRIYEAPLFSNEVRGLRSLRQFADAVWEGRPDAAMGRRGNAASRQNIRPIAASPHRRVEQPRPITIFGGKGGVGKTTAAAATAIEIAEANPEKRALVFSADPAHSLSDSFDEAVGQLKHGVAGVGNLDGIEVDPARWFEDLKKRYRKWTDDLFESLTSGSRWQIKFEREAMRELVELAPPGIDEIAALASIIDLLDENRYDFVVLDTAPTGHLIRFLELPEIALQWARTLIKLLLKYREVARWGDMAEELVALSRSVKRVMALLTDRKTSEFVGVAIAERMSFEETLRLTRSLKRLKVPMRRLLINNVVPVEAARACDFCAARFKSHQGVVRDFMNGFNRGTELLIAPEQPREIKGIKRLREHIQSWQILVETDERKRAKEKKR